jgi:hypothetical protein
VTKRAEKAPARKQKLPRRQRLKVFQAPFGFYESVLAVPSKAAALKTWGSQQDLFAEGFAKPATDERAIAAALAHPGVPLVRAVGSDDPFEVKARSLPKPPREPKSPTRPAPKLVAQKRPPPDRGLLDAAESALRRLETAFRRDEADLANRMKALKQAQEVMRRAHRTEKAAAQAEMKTARAAYRKAGGRS